MVNVREQLDPPAIALRLREIVDSGECVLFAGAGVSARAGLPTWSQFIEMLAIVCEQHGDALAAALMRDRLKDGDFLGAASVFKTSRRIAEGEKWAALAGPFNVSPKIEQLEKLDPLLQLPFAAIVTTNYDRILHDVFARVRNASAVPVERGDGSLRGAALRRESYIVRLHGRAELPTSMVLDSYDYANLLNEPDYLDFILELFRTRVCLFVGFSFVDPAIDSILGLYKDRFGPTYRRLHAAIIPSDATALASRLLAVNIEPILYNPLDEQSDLWRSIRLASTGRRDDDVDRRQVAVSLALRNVSNTHRFLSFAYAQSRAAAGNSAVVALVQDGLVAALLAEHAGEIVPETAVIGELSVVLRVTTDEAKKIVTTSLDRLSLTRRVERDQGALIHDFVRDDTLEAQLKTLVAGVVDRLKVRDGIAAKPTDVELAREVIESLFITRAWDVAAHYAGASTGIGADLGRAVHVVVDRLRSGRAISSLPALESALVDLFLAPEDREAVLLAEIGRVAFGLQLVLSSPRQALFHQDVLPQIIYLDANVLMPAIVSGHPLRPVYKDALARLSEAARRAAASIEIIVGQQFLNEIISHRAIAIQMADELGFDDPATVEKHVLFYGATDTNVFVGAYASHVSRDLKAITFRQFLQQFAPYETELQLARYLREKMQISVVDMHFYGDHRDTFGDLLGRLRAAYPFGKKASVVIEHEAQQLTQLRVDHEAGRRSVFVTADNKLRRILQGSAALHDLASVAMSHLGLVALVDVLVGIETDARSLSRLLWSSSYYGEEERALYEYFVRLGLRRYSEGMADEMQDLARKTAAVAAEEARRETINFFSGAAEDVVLSAKLIDRFGDDFFKNWREAIEQREKQDRNLE